MQENVFNNEELQVIGKFFTLMLRASQREGLLQRSQPEMAKLKEEPAQKNRLIPLTKWPDYHDWPTVGGLRHLVFYSQQLGFDKVIRRVGRRVLIDEDAFFEWARNNPKMKSIDPPSHYRKGN